MIAAVIVTYNRKELLAENISMLLKQTRPVDKIFIIDNCSTDGTGDYLMEKGWKDSSQFVYIKTEANIGGAGGFYTGTKAAYEYGADWLLLMDDDGRPADEFTVERLMDEAEKLHRENVADKKIFVNALVYQGELLSFKMGNKYTVKEALDAAVDGILQGESNPFNGTLISKELVDAIGYPNKDFFIKGDEVDFRLRSIQEGASICTVVDAKYIHPRPEVYERKVLGKKVPFSIEAPWKEYYSARNFAYMYKKEKRYKGIAFELIVVKTLAVFSMKCKKFKTLYMILKGVYDGCRGKLGATVKPG